METLEINLFESFSQIVVMSVIDKYGHLLVKSSKTLVLKK